jgi:lysophospholipase L1-like esterase
MKRILLLVVVLALLCPMLAHGAPVLKAGDRLAICGDSITEQKIYSRFIEEYLLACHPELNLTIMQFGWGGERALGFLNRMDNDLKGFAPTVVTTCYGMNDGSYTAYTDAIGKNYQDPLRTVVEKLKAQGVTVVVGSPGAVDSTSYRKDPAAAKVYNENLAHLGELAKQVATDNGMPFADVHTPMMEAMTAAKAALGDAFLVCGGDGVHPGADGHLIMAYAFLKGLGVDGDLGTITVDMKGASTATGGHKVLGGTNGTANIESSRYPFCFFGGPQDPGGTACMLPFLPFAQDLDRFLLVVKGLTTAQAKVTWGETSKTFARADLEKGINLPVEFLSNPFGKAWANLDSAVAQQETWETFMIKSQISQNPWLLGQLDNDPAVANALTALGPPLWKREAKGMALARAQVVPVQHTITVSEVAG